MCLVVCFQLAVSAATSLDELESRAVALKAKGDAESIRIRGEALKQRIPSGRFAFPEEIAAAAVFLASNGADMINGADLLVDGGYTIV